MKDLSDNFLYWIQTVFGETREFPEKNFNTHAQETLFFHFSTFKLPF